MTFVDPPGDQDLGVQGVYTGYETQPNLDITGGYFSYVPTGTRNVMTANIQIAELNDDVQPGSSGHTYYFYFDVNDGTYLVSANLTSDGWTFGYGDLGVSGPGNNQTGDTTGKIYPGTDGLISIVVPVSAMKLEGKTLATPYASSRVSLDLVAIGLVPTADDGPDTQEGKDFKVSVCNPGGGGTGGGDTGGGTGGGGDGGGGTLVQPPQQTKPFDAKVSPTRFRARKVKRARSVRFNVDAQEELKKAKFTFKKGRKTLGSKSAASFTKGRVTIKLKKRGLRKGSYSFTVAGTRANGAVASEVVKVRVR